MTQSLVFSIGGEQFTLPHDIVGEVLPIGRVTRVPHAADALIGLGNVRGVVLPMVSFAALLGRPRGGERRIIVVGRDQPIGLVVEDVTRLTEGHPAGAIAVDPFALMDEHFAAGLSAPRRAPRLAMPAADRGPEAARAAKALLVIAVAGQSFAFPLEEIEEVIAHPASVVVPPGVDATVAGSVAHRGSILPLLSLRALLKLDGPAPAKPCIVILRVKARPVGLVVDAVTAIMRVDLDTIDPVPVILTRSLAETRIQAIHRRTDGSLVSLLARDHLLSAAAMARLPDEAAPETRQREDGMETFEPVLVFRLGEEEFGLPVDAVREVVALPDRLTRLPRAPAFVEGMMNLRGHAIPVIDQRRRFDVAAEAHDRRRVIVTALGEVEVGFVVDAVSEVLRIPAGQLRPAPDMGEGARLFDRVANLEDGARMMLVIAPQALLDRAERDLLAAMGDGDARPQP